MSRLDDIERRLAALGAKAQEPSAPDAGQPDFWALAGLEQRIDPEGTGAVVFAGSVAPEGGRIRWQYGLTTEALSGADWEEAAPALAALGNNVRLRLLQLILNGSHEVADLSAADGIGTTGQVYHHLRALVAAGWLRASARGSYEIPPTRVVPLLVVLTACLNA